MEKTCEWLYQSMKFDRTRLWRKIMKKCFLPSRQTCLLEVCVKLTPRSAVLSRFLFSSMAFIYNFEETLRVWCKNVICCFLFLVWLSPAHGVLSVQTTNLFCHKKLKPAQYTFFKLVMFSLYIKHTFTIKFYKTYKHISWTRKVLSQNRQSLNTSFWELKI